MVDKNLFPYNLAVAAIFKNEAPGQIMQMPAYNDALNRFRFFCR